MGLVTLFYLTDWPRQAQWLPSDERDWIIAQLEKEKKVALSLIFFTLCGAAYYSFHPAFWPVPTEFLSESAAAASIGLINSIGNLGGFFGPMIMGYLVSRTHSFAAGPSYLVGSFFVCGILMLAVGSARRLPSVHSSPKAA